MRFSISICSAVIPAVEGEFKDSSNKQQASLSAETDSAGQPRYTHDDWANEKGLYRSVCVRQREFGFRPTLTHHGFIKHITNTLSVG